MRGVTAGSDKRNSAINNPRPIGVRTRNAVAPPPDGADGGPDGMRLLLYNSCPVKTDPNAARDLSLRAEADVAKRYFGSFADDYHRAFNGTGQNPLHATI